MNKPVVLFDINETVLNLAALKPLFSAAFGNEQSLSLWFAQLLHSSTVCIATEVKTDFASLAGVALEALASSMGRQLSAEQVQAILSGFASLPAHSDVEPALQQLKAAGFTTVAFSNSSSSLIKQQIGNSGLSDLFDQVLSVEASASFKPDPRVYLDAAEHLQRAPAELLLVACHDWDTHGALSAGLQAAYIARKPQDYNPLYLAPAIMEFSMQNLVQRIIERSN